MGKKSHRIKERYRKKLAALGKNVKRIREAKGMTQEFVAFNSGTSFTTVNSLENGHLNPTIATLYGIAEALKVPIGELIEE